MIEFRQEPNENGEVCSVYVSGNFFCHIEKTPRNRYRISGFADNMPESLLRERREFLHLSKAREQAKCLAIKCGWMPEDD